MAFPLAASVAAAAADAAAYALYHQLIDLAEVAYGDADYVDDDDGDDGEPVQLWHPAARRLGAPYAPKLAAIPYLSYPTEAFPLIHNTTLHLLFF